MSAARRLIEDYFRRTGLAADGLDGAWQYQVTVLRDLVTRLEVILEDEEVHPATAERVLRAVLYGAPSPADAELRMRQQEAMVKLAERVPPAPVGPVASMFPPHAERKGQPR